MYNTVLFQEWYELVLTVTELCMNLQLRNLDSFGEAPFPYDVVHNQGHNRTPTPFTDTDKKEPLSPEEEECEAVHAQGTDKLNAEAKTHE